jgi:antitoxin VapB
MLVAPIAHVEQIENDEADRALVAWQHKMGPCKRPMGLLVSHGLFAHGKLCAVVVTADLVAETCAGFTRQDAVELARLCACRSDLCRPMVRLWREFVFPAFGRPWAVSYQDEALHSGNVYRFDGWWLLAEHQRSGPDKRSGRKGRSKAVWGWNPAGKSA